jgi:hypothetical protein
MIQKKNLRRASGLSIILVLVCIAVGASCTAAQQSQTILDITGVTGGLGEVSVTVKNIGDSTAEKITIMISVKGGIFNKIAIEKTCSGCDACGTTIEPNAIKTESTSESGMIIGFGPVTITASAEAENAEKVEKTYNGFVLGLFVIITQ